LTIDSSACAHSFQIEKHQRRAPERAEQIDECNGEDQCRKNAARSACIEADEGKSIRRKVAQDIARDQIAAEMTKKASTPTNPP
jgi:hypothetical protein